MAYFAAKGNGAIEDRLGERLCRSPLRLETSREHKKIRYLCGFSCAEKADQEVFIPWLGIIFGFFRGGWRCAWDEFTMLDA
jgi:hypothetical protein